MIVYVFILLFIFVFLVRNFQNGSAGQLPVAQCNFTLIGRNKIFPLCQF